MTKSKENTAVDRVLCFLFSFACAVAEGENGIYKDEIPTDKIRAVPIRNRNREKQRSARNLRDFIKTP